MVGRDGELFFMQHGLCLIPQRLQEVFRTSFFCWRTKHEARRLPCGPLTQVGRKAVRHQPGTALLVVGRNDVGGGSARGNDFLNDSLRMIWYYLCHAVWFILYYDFMNLWIRLSYRTAHEQNSPFPTHRQPTTQCQKWPYGIRSLKKQRAALYQTAESRPVPDGGEPVRREE